MVDGSFQAIIDPFPAAEISAVVIEDDGFEELLVKVLILLSISVGDDADAFPASFFNAMLICRVCSRAGITEFIYILIPLVLILSTNALCANRYRIIRGMMIISVPVARIQLEYAIDTVVSTPVIL